METTEGLQYNTILGVLKMIYESNALFTTLRIEYIPEGHKKSTVLDLFKYEEEDS